MSFVLAEGAVQAQFHGWQGQLLREMILDGAEYLVQPADFYHQCLRARLLPQTYEESKMRSTVSYSLTLLSLPQPSANLIREMITTMGVKVPGHSLADVVCPIDFSV